MRVEAIREKDIEKVIRYLKRHKDKRRYCIFVLGINTGLRIGDLVGLKVGDLKNKDYLTVVEQKTEKRRRLIINQDIKDMLEQYYGGSSKKEYLFKSQKGGHISEVQAWRWFKEMKKACRIKYNIGTHSMRKSLGRKTIEKHKIEVVQKVLGHSSPKHTLAYLGIEQEMVDDVMMNIGW